MKTIELLYNDTLIPELVEDILRDGPEPHIERASAILQTISECGYCFRKAQIDMMLLLLSVYDLSDFPALAEQRMTLSILRVYDTIGKDPRAKVADTFGGTLADLF